MFTGLIERTEKVIRIESIEGGKKFFILTHFKNDDVEVGHSVAINGVCLTVETVDTDQNGKTLSFYASYKTLEITNLGDLNVGSSVNLERAVLPTTRMGGHIVQGHVDGTGVILERKERDAGSVIEFVVRVLEDHVRYIVEKGSIAIDGISLTVVSITGSHVTLVIIPETIRKTNIHSWEAGKRVNIETDILARYAEKWNGK
jgi:riboflavin synthase